MEAKLEIEDTGCGPSYCLAVTYQCNWDCDYCCVDTHNQKEPSEERVLALAEKVEPEAHVSLTGGERVVGVNTNGLWFINYPQYASRINDYRYHCSLDLKNKIWQPPGHEEMNIKYVIVVTDKNFPRLEKFLSMNEHIDVAVYAADQHVVHGKPGTKLSAGNRIKLYQQFKDKNIRMDNIEYLFSRNSKTSQCSNLVRLHRSTPL